MDLSTILTNKSVFLSIAEGGQPCPDLAIDESKYNQEKRWEIFSRIRFEYVRPTCTLRSQSMPSVCPSMTEEEKDFGLKAYIKAGLNPDKKAINSLLRVLHDPITGSVGEELAEYYLKEKVPTPNSEASLFPANYIIIHDLHHILLNSDTSQKGEMEIIAFESGMLNKNPAPVLLLEQLEIFLSDKTDCIDSRTLCKAWEIGSGSTPLFEDWNWVDDLDIQLSEAREKYNIIPLR